MSRHQLQSDANKANWIIFGITIIIITIIIVFLRSADPSTVSGNQSSVSVASPIVVSEKSFNFGTISMADGKVSKLFNISNPGDKPIIITKLYTSCMCTKATLIINGTRIGPIGMIGHGVVPDLNEIIASNSNAAIEVQYDPAAHGPSGVGKIARDVYVETSDGGRLDLKISAEVTP